MPQISIEYSNNIKNIDFSSLFAAIHQALSQVAEISHCKSRATCLDNYFVGDGATVNGIFFIKIALMPGRSTEQKDKLAQAIKEAVNIFVAPIINRLSLTCIPTCEIVDLQHYTRY